MSRSWQTIFQKGTSGLSNDAVDQLSGIEVDLATALASSSSSQITFSHSGAATVGVGTMRFPLGRDATVTGVLASAGTAPTGADLIVDVNKNGTTIFTTQANRPTVAASANQSSVSTPDVTSLSAGDYVTVDIDQVGSSVAGSDITVVVLLA